MRLKLAEPIVLLPGDRFVLRQPSPAGTIGGGLVLDAHPLPRQRSLPHKAGSNNCAQPLQRLELSSAYPAATQAESHLMRSLLKLA